jgi:hypothetical protein
VLRYNRVNTEISYPLMSSKGFIKLWMREMDGYTMEMVEKVIRCLNPWYLRKLPCPTHMWDFKPHDRLTRRLI